MQVSVGVLLGLTSVASAYTLVPPEPTYGTWYSNNSPYVIVDNVSVPSGQTLTIQPGVEVWIGSGLTLTVNGVVKAVGTPSRRIAFRPPSEAQSWDMISIGTPTGTNIFEYCDFWNAQVAIKFSNASSTRRTLSIRHCDFWNANTALNLQQNITAEVMYSSFKNVTNAVSMEVSGGNYDQTTKIMNCMFSNCVACAVNGTAQGRAGNGVEYHSLLRATIRNCIFESVGDGCRFYMAGEYFTVPVPNPPRNTGRGYCWCDVRSSVMSRVTGTAISMQVGNQYVYSSAPVIVNNTIVNCLNGFVTSDPYDAKLQGNIFIGLTNGVRRSGSLSTVVSYNNFYANATNFVGYPSTYGEVLITNRNGTPSDLLFNIFEDPLFVGTNDYHLATNSPCIDAGPPDWAYTDMCFTNGASQGNSCPDLGAYGGPDACNWLDAVPVLPVTAFMTKTNQAIWLNWGAVPRSSYQVHYLTNLAIVGTNVWTNFPAGIITPSDKPASVQVSTSTSATNKMFFRVESLGKTPGN